MHHTARLLSHLTWCEIAVVEQEIRSDLRLVLVQPGDVDDHMSVYSATTVREREHLSSDDFRSPPRSGAGAGAGGGGKR